MNTFSTTRRIIQPAPVPSGTDVRALRVWMNTLQASVHSCLDAIRVINVDVPAICPRDYMLTSASVPIYPYLRHGFTIAGTTITLLSGKLKFHGSKVCTTAQADFTLGGTQYFYVHHVRSSSTCAWASAGAEPGCTSTTDLDVFFYKFVGLTLATDSIGHLGDINLDVPLA
jgi:hypothetical protein